MTLHFRMTGILLCITLSLFFQSASPSSFVSLTPPPKGFTHHRIIGQHPRNKLDATKIREGFFIKTLRHVLHSTRSNFYHELRGGAGPQSISIPPLAFASTMSFLAGCSDVVCIRRFHCYTSMMTGNIITMSVAIAERNWIEVMWKLSLVTCFFIGTCAARTIYSVFPLNRDSAKDPAKHQHLKYVAAFVFALFVLYDLLPGNQRWAVTLLALAYGMVYSSANQALDATITQLMTGHITKLGTAISDRFLGPCRQWNKGTLMSLCIVSSFVIGVIFGVGVSTSSFGKDGPFFTLLGFLYSLTLALYR